MPLSCQRRRGWRQFTTLQGLTGRFHRYHRLAGNPHLAQSTAVPLEFVGFLNILSGADQMLPTFFFVMARFSDGPDRAPVNAFSTGPFSEKRGNRPDDRRTVVVLVQWIPWRLPIPPAGLCLFR